MCASRIVVEISSDEDTPTKKKCTVSSKEEVICLDDAEPSTSKKIEITIQQQRPRATLRPAPLLFAPPPRSTRITIRFEEDQTDSCLPSPPPDNHLNLLTQSKSPTGRRKSNDDANDPFSDFVQLCLLLERSEDMESVIEKKVKYYYGRADREYVSSRRFRKFLEYKKDLVRTDSANLWVHIKDVVDALKVHKMEESMPQTENICDPEVEQRVQELERKLGELRQLVHRLEQQEVDWDDDCSAYIKADKYKTKLVSVYAELCRLRGTTPSAWARVSIERRHGRAQGPARRLEDWVNTPVARGQPPRFPDYHDVLSCVRYACRVEQLLWSDIQIHDEARELFVACGRALQRQRWRRDRRLASDLITRADLDPADTDERLRDELQNNAGVAAQREQQVFDEFVNKQMFLKTSREETDRKKRKSEPSEHSRDNNTKDDESSLDSEPEEVGGRETKDQPVGRERKDLITSHRESSEEDCVCLSSDQSCSSSPAHSDFKTCISSDEEDVAHLSDSSDSECVVIAES